MKTAILVMISALTLLGAQAPTKDEIVNRRVQCDRIRHRGVVGQQNLLEGQSLNRHRYRSRS